MKFNNAHLGRPSRSIGVLTCDPLVWSTLEKSVSILRNKNEIGSTLVLEL
jgi:hypothetical protein